MIVGVGTDLVEVARIARALDRHGDRLVRRLLTDGEIAAQGAVSAPWLAKRFAAKEAGLKALGTGWAQGLGFHDIEVLRAAGAAPELRLSPRALAHLGHPQVRGWVSLADERRYAVAFVLLET